MTAWRRAAMWVGGLAGAFALGVALVLWLNVRGEASVTATRPGTAMTPELVERGAYLSRAGNCLGCHTTPGGQAFAGGRRIETPFGAVVAPNITPDETTGIGAWSTADFWRALHHGRSRDGRLLYPAFPYPSFTKVRREDADALFAYLRSVPAVQRRNDPHELRFPYNTQAALAVWRALYFRPADVQASPTRTTVLQRGEYLVQGLGHCAACHSGRNFLGGTSLNAEFAGGLMPDQSWYAPSLTSPAEAGAQRMGREQVVGLLKRGVTAGASVSGPMAEVVFSSTQYLSDADLGAMAEYLASLPVRAPAVPAFSPADPQSLQRGARLYADHCASCHGSSGEGAAGKYPPLAANRAVTMPVANNLVQMIRHGGFAPTTVGNPRPFGMPPYGQVLSDQQIADVATYVRQSWGNEAAAVSPLDVLHVR